MITDLLKTLNERSVSLSVDNGSLKVLAPKNAITPDIAGMIRENKQAIIDLLQAAQASKTLTPTKRQAGDTPLLSFAQQRMIFLEDMARATDEASHQYNLPIVLALNGTIDSSRLEAALRAIVERHIPLRTGVDAESGALLFHHSHDFSLTQEQCVSQADALQKAEVCSRQTFMFDQDFMLKARLFTVADDQAILLVNFHHVASDGWSLGVFLQELQAFYNGDDVAPLALDYLDYAAWQAKVLASDELDQQLNYWQEQLADIPPVHHLPLSFPRPSTLTTEGAVYTSDISSGVSSQLTHFARARQTTAFTLLQTVFSLLIARLSNQSEVVMGTPHAGRDNEAFNGLIGLFVNTLVLRSRIDSEQSFDEMFRQAIEASKGMQANSQVPLDLLIQTLNPPRSEAYAPLFQLMFIYEPLADSDCQLQGMDVHLVDIDDDAAKVELCLRVVEQSDGLTLNWDYNTSLFDQATIARFDACFHVLLQQALNHPTEAVFSLPMLDDASMQQCLQDWGQNPMSFDDYPSIVALFQHQVKQQPDATAIIAEGQRLSYQQLDQQSDVLAAYLCRQGVTVGDIVGIYVARDESCILALLAVLKCGAAYLPLSTEYPDERLDYMVSNSGAKAVIYREGLKPAFANAVLQIELTAGLHGSADAEDTALSDTAAERPTGDWNDNTAYVIYTSGSTGKPKGVALAHRGLINMAQAKAIGFQVGAGDNVLQYAAFSFDAATSEWVMALCSGATLTMVSETIRLNPELLTQWVQQQAVTHATIPPALLSVLDRQRWQGVKTLISAGESVPASVADQWAENRLFINAYGPSEATVCSTLKHYQPGSPLTIGQPLANMECYVLNRSGQLQPTGVIGELYVGGVGLAQGYLHQPELTAEKFAMHSFNKVSDNYGLSSTTAKRLYATGDLVRWLANGELEFIGRVDNQISLRGFRIELGEIEEQLEKDPGVKQSLVWVDTPENGSKTLVACVVRSSDNQSQDDSTFSRQLLQSVAGFLPSHMVPQHLFVLDELPLTVNGKVDKSRLPSLESITEPSGRQPATSTEQALTALWADVLTTGVPSVEHTFFQLGGHSLLVASLISAIARQFDVVVAVPDVFRYNTVESLAAHIDHLLANNAGSHRLPAITPLSGATPRLSYQQQRLWFLSQSTGSNANYNVVEAKYLHGVLDTAKLAFSLQTLIANHQVLRTLITLDDNGEPALQLQPETQFTLAVQDISNLSDEQQQACIDTALEAAFQTGFDFSTELPIRAQWFCLNKNPGHEQGCLILTIHHIAIDGWSMNVFYQQLAELYNGDDCTDSNTALQYVDYANWQQTVINGDIGKSQLSWWQEQLADMPGVHQLPLSKERSIDMNWSSATHVQTFDAQQTAQLKTLATRENTTLFMVLQSAFAVLLSRLQHSDDIVMGTPLAGRPTPETESMIGFFAETLVLRARPSAELSFADFLQQNSDWVMQSFERQLLPFDELVKALNPARSEMYSPLFQIMFSLQNNAADEVTLNGLRLESINTEILSDAKFDLTLNVMEDEQGLTAEWQYSQWLFTAEQIQAMADSWLTLLTGILNDSNTQLGQLPLLSATTDHPMARANLEAQRSYETNIRLEQLFARAAARHPYRIAVKSTEQQLTFAELDAKSTEFAAYLQAQLMDKSAVSQPVVAICCDRDINLIVAMLAAMKAGATYVPMDPSNPVSRLHYVIDNAGASLVISDQHHADLFADNRCKVPVCRVDLTEHYTQGAISTNAQLSADQPLYLLYTSGSTGQPKGVTITHRSTVNLAHGMAELIAERLDADSQGHAQANVWGWVASAAFDASVQGITQLCLGHTLAIIPAESRQNPALLARQLDEMSVNIMDCTPAIAELLVEQPESWWLNTSLALMFVGGESIRAALWQSLAARRTLNHGVKVVNVYGPTECTVNSTFADVLPDISPTIGTPLPNVACYVLDEHHQLVPVGGYGELYISGAGVANGYVGLDEMTRERFITLSIAGGEPRRLYKTGDIVVAQDNADHTQLTFIGRNDDQVKIRGYRIELDEIANGIQQHPAVKEVCVQVKAPNTPAASLVAFVTVSDAEHSADSEQSLDNENTELQAGIISFMRDRLPEYMCPQSLHVLDSFPLTTSGKVDRKALLALDADAVKPVRYHQAETPEEQALQVLFADVLSLSDLPDTRTGFFELGGHSLAAIRLISQINQQFSAQLSVVDLYHGGTIQRLAQTLTSNNISDDSRSAHRLLAELTPVESLTHVTSVSTQRLFVIPGVGSTSMSFKPLAEHLASQMRVSAFTVAGLENDQPEYQNLSVLLTDYANEITAVQPHGDILLAGHSLGGKLALALADRLIASGRTVKVLTLDTILNADNPALQLPAINLPEQRISQARERVLAVLDSRVDCNSATLTDFIELMVATDVALSDVDLIRRLYRHFIAMQRIDAQCAVTASPHHEKSREHLTVLLAYSTQTLPDDRRLHAVLADYRTLTQGNIETVACDENHFDIVASSAVAQACERLKEL